MIKLGDINIRSIKVGSADCKVYLGDTLVYGEVAIKFSANYSGGESYSGVCDSDSTLRSGDVKPSGYDHTTMISAEIGDCITEIQAYAFFNFTSLSSVTISENVTDIGTRGFYGCSGLVDINLPSGLTSINDSVFQNCSNLSFISIPNTITSIGVGAFQGCSSLTNIELPSGITSIGGGAFAGCESLSSVTVNASVPPTLGGDLVFWNTNDCPIYVLASSVEAYKTAWADYADRIQAMP